MRVSRHVVAKLLIVSRMSKVSCQNKVQSSCLTREQESNKSPFLWFCVSDDAQPHQQLIRSAIFTIQFDVLFVPPGKMPVH